MNPTLGITEPAEAPRALPLVDDFDDQFGSVPNGWSLDPGTGANTVVQVAGDRLTIRGPGLASIAHQTLFDPLVDGQFTMTLDIDSISSDNWFGAYITNDIYSRGVHVGPLFNMATKQMFLNADPGGGFNGVTDRVLLGSLPSYTGGDVTLQFTFDQAGFEVVFDAGAEGMLESGFLPWSVVEEGFDPTLLGDAATLYVQSFDLASNFVAASATIDSIALTTPGIVGDYNEDGIVNLADYTVWRDNLGANSSLPNEDPSATPGTVTAEDYDVWKANFGTGSTTFSGFAGQNVAVPEPATIHLILAIAWMLCSRVRSTEAPKSSPMTVTSS